MVSRLIDHYIITRFNLRPSTANAAALEPAWLQARAALFETFCLPTVRAQTSTDFTWLLLFDQATPAQFRERIQEWARWPLIRPLFLEAGSEDVGRLAVKTAMQRVPDLLLTTRLDNDDGLACDYVETIRRLDSVNSPTVFEFPYGYVWQSGRAYRDRQDNNPFVTLAEPLARNPLAHFSTVYCGDHHESYKLGRMIRVSDKPGWLQVVHGGNLANRARGIRAPVATLKGRFHLPETLLSTKESAWEILSDQLKTGLTQSARRGWRILRNTRRLLP